MFCIKYFMLFVACLFCTSCSLPSANNIVVERDDFAEVVKAKIGDAVIVYLKSNLSTGYKWDLKDEVREVVLESRNFENSQNEGHLKLCGKPILEKFVFRCVNRGQCSIYFEYKRNWENNAVEKYCLKIKVE